MTILDLRTSSHCSSARRMGRALRRRFAPALDLLEGRSLLSTLVVTNNQDSGTGSLRQVIDDAHSGDTLTFAPKLRGEVITLTSGELDVNKSLIIDGPGADQLAVSGDGVSRVFEISSGATVTISGLLITGGQAVQGGGIFNAGTLTLKDCDVAANQAAATAGGAAQGGGIYSAGGALTIVDSTLSDNQADGGSGASGSGGNGQGGGIYYAPSGSQGTLIPCATLHHGQHPDRQRGQGRRRGQRVQLRRSRSGRRHHGPFRLDRDDHRQHPDWQPSGERRGLEPRYCDRRRHQQRGQRALDQ